MSFVAVNAITVPEGKGDELAKRFAARAGEVDQADGFLGFRLLRPTDGNERWLVMTEWRDEAAFQGWVNSPAFQHGHAQSSGPGGPVAAHSELWTFTVEQTAAVT